MNRLSAVDPHHKIRSMKRFYSSIIAMIALVLGFTFGSGFGIQPSVIDILLAAIMLLITREPVDAVLVRVRWGTIFFLVGSLV